MLGSAAFLLDEMERKRRKRDEGRFDIEDALRDREPRY